MQSAVLEPTLEAVPRRVPLVMLEGTLLRVLLAALSVPLESTKVVQVPLLVLIVLQEASPQARVPICASTVKLASTACPRPAVLIAPPALTLRMLEVLLARIVQVDRTHLAPVLPAAAPARPESTLGEQGVILASIARLESTLMMALVNALTVQLARLPALLAYPPVLIAPRALTPVVVLPPVLLAPWDTS